MEIKKSLAYAAIALGAMTAATSALALSGVGLTANQTLVGFRTGNPSDARSGPAVTGFVGGDTALVGIDYRVQNGLLYGVGNGGGIYTVDTSTGALTFVNSLSVAMEGTVFGVDFNPAADRLRIISNTGQNLRHNVNVGGITLLDTALSTPPTIGATANVVGAAYTNNDLVLATGTSIYDINTGNGMLVIQSPANSGTLAGIGSLGVTTTLTPVGFDIYSRLSSGTTVANRGYVALTDGSGTTSGYDVNLQTGAASLRGAFPATLIDIALSL